MIRGACPGLHEPMASGDGLLVRLRAPAGGLSGDQAEGLDRAARRFGDGGIEITSRGNLQLRGVDAADHAALVGAVLELGLGRRDPEAERRIRVLAAPFLGAGARVRAALEAALEATDALDRLAPKFLFAVEGGPVRLGSTAADIAIDTDRDRLVLHDREAALRGRDPVGLALAVAAAFLALPRPAGAPPRRMRELDPAGRAALLAGSGLDPRAAPAPRAAGAGIGRLAPGIVGVRPPFGALSPGGLARLAAIAAAHADGALRPTVGRRLLLGGAGPGAGAALGAAGMVTAPEDPRARIVACPGAPACAAGDGPARAVAARFAALVPASGVLHLSGCGKGCAHPGPARLVFTALPGGGFRRAENARADGVGGVAA